MHKLLELTNVIEGNGLEMPIMVGPIIQAQLITKRDKKNMPGLTINDFKECFDSVSLPFS